MGKIVEHPRYNVISCRTNDQEKKEIEAAIGIGNRAAFVLEAILEKARREKQRRIDHALSDRSL